MIPDTVLQKVRFSPHRITRMKLMSFSHAVLDPNDLWHFRKRMTMSMASFIFSSYVLSMSGRTPARMHISRSTGKLYSSEMVPCKYYFLRLEPCVIADNRSFHLYSPRRRSTRILQSRICTFPIHSQHSTLHRTARNRRSSHELFDGDCQMLDRSGGTLAFL